MASNIFPHLYSFLVLTATLQVAQCAEFQVMVGASGLLQFDPPTVDASVGDVVTFIFQQGNHSVTQSTFQSPCEMSPDGFDTGFLPVTDSNAVPAAQYNVSSTDPVWVYCRQPGHCEQGMVFAINPGDQFAAFVSAATGGALSSSAPPAPPPSSTSAPPASSSPPSSSPEAASSSSAPASTSQSQGQQSTEPAAAPTTISAPSPPETISSASSSVALSSAVPSSTSSAASAASPSNYVVIVGGSSLAFTPANITVQVGDSVTFQFHQKNHTATQSTFAAPCVGLTDSSTSGQIGFDSGFMPVADNATLYPTFTITINDTSPIWAYCKTGDHCGLGMVFAINAPSSGSDTFAAFQARAKELNGTSPFNATTVSSASCPKSGSWSTRQYAGATAATVVTMIVGLTI
ncbi:cupredoxin domain-containing protein [Phanerochaete sordida]|uniref:Cupredoxin domain-containing protein n=1 Tax=Phanerochaete sordida TaxID=48140 RepID=A0A9P3LBK5_9APHY|nr:cupredoxin domain-containing protein [Phanerochaete sordida]